MKILTSLHGRLIGLAKGGQLLVPAGFVAGENGKHVVLPGADYASYFDDFVGATQAFSTTIANGLRSRKGSDGACVDWTQTAAPGGSIVGTMGNTTASMAVAGIQLDTGLNWKANQGALRFTCRLKMSRITNMAVFLGFTDQVAALEMPIQSAASADTITTNAADAVGFMFDTSQATDNWWLVGVANDVDATLQNTGVAPVADTYEYFAVELDALGNATFFRNGKTVGTRMSGAATKTIALTPVIAGFNRTTTGAPTVTSDMWAVSALRA